MVYQPINLRNLRNKALFPSEGKGHDETLKTCGLLLKYCSLIRSGSVACHVNFSTRWGKEDGGEEEEGRKESQPFVIF